MWAQVLIYVSLLKRKLIKMSSKIYSTYSCFLDLTYRHARVSCSFIITSYYYLIIFNESLISFRNYMIMISLPPRIKESESTLSFVCEKCSPIFDSCFRIGWAIWIQEEQPQLHWEWRNRELNGKVGMIIMRKEREWDEAIEWEKKRETEWFLFLWRCNQQTLWKRDAIESK